MCRFKNVSAVCIAMEKKGYFWRSFHHDLAHYPLRGIAKLKFGLNTEEMLL
jgi:hypothetical protein